MGNLEFLIMNKLLLLTIFAFCCVTVSGQQKKHVANVPGEVVIADDISIVQARENAINQAKIEALRRAGVPEFVSEVTVLQKSEKGIENFSEVFNSLTNQEISGEIAAFSLIKEEKTTNLSGNYVMKVWIDADVIIHERHSDPAFYAKIKGIRENYTSPEDLTFEFYPASSGYLNVFIIDEKESSLLFPNTLERSELLEANRTYNFPLSKALTYEVATINNVEVNYIVMLFTKNEIRYTEGKSVSEMLNFVARISPDQKFVRMYPILIRNKK